MQPINVNTARSTQAPTAERAPRGNSQSGFQQAAGANGLAGLLGLLMPLVQQLLQQLQQTGSGNPPANTTLTLSTQQQAAIRQRFDDASPLLYDGLATEFTGKAVDKDGNGKLSIGDVVELRKYGGRAQTNYIEQHVLTAADMTAINA